MQDIHSFASASRKMFSNNPCTETFNSTHLLQKVIEESTELVHKLIKELGAGDVYAVEDGELIIAEIVVGGRAGLQDLSVCVLIYHLPNLPQQSIQMLYKNKKTQHCFSDTELFYI